WRQVCNLPIRKKTASCKLAATTNSTEGDTMSKERSKPADYAAYLALRFGVSIIQMLSYEASMRLAKVVAWIVYWIDRRHRLVAADNLRHAFPNLSDDQIDSLVRATYRHFIGLVMVIVHLPRRFHVYAWRNYLDMTGERYLAAALLSGRPLLLVTGHFGNW